MMKREGADCIDKVKGNPRPRKGSGLPRTCKLGYF